MCSLNQIKNIWNYLLATTKPRFVSIFNTGPRRIYRIKNKNKFKRKEISHGITEMDNHADAAACGSNFTKLNYTSQEYGVTPYNSKDVEKNVPIATCATALDNSTGTTCIIKIH